MRCILGRICLLVLGIMLTGLLANTAVAGIAYGDPAGGWTYTYDGEDSDDAPDFGSLDGTWDHDNGSDQWDGTGIGAGSPGGVFVLSDGPTTYLRMVDTGDPRDAGFPDPGNRKFFFTHNIGEGGDESASDTQIDEGITLSFRARIPIDGPLDGVAAGDGYVNHDGGKSTFTVSQAGDDGKTISFFLAAEEEDQTDFLGPGLGMNSLDEAGGLVDWQGSEGTPNLFALDDPTEWHEFWINILAVDGLPGSHLAIVYADGSLIETPFNVSAGDGRDEDVNYIAMGLGSTPQHGAVDIDFLSWAPGVLPPVGIDTGPSCDFDGNSLCGEDDINLLMNEAETGGTTADLNADGVVNDADRDLWLASAGEENGFAGPLLVGDSDLSGKVDAADLNAVALAWQNDGEFNWANGNYTIGGGPGVRVNDLNALGLEWQNEVGPAAAAGEAVPEPTGIALALVGLLGLFAVRRR